MQDSGLTLYCFDFTISFFIILEALKNYFSSSKLYFIKFVYVIEPLGVQYGINLHEYVLALTGSRNTPFF